MKKKLILMGLVSAPLFAVTTALAVPPTGFTYQQFAPGASAGTGGFEASAGVVTADCPAGYTCVALAGSGSPGMTQERVTDNLSGDAYIRTIVVDDAADTTTPLDFYNQSFVGVSETTEGDVGVESFVSLVGSVGSGFSQANIGRGALQGPNDADRITLKQQNLSGGSNPRTTNFDYFDSGANGRYLRIDHSDGGGATGGGNVTIRTSNGAYTCIDPDTPAGAGNPGCGTGSITLKDGTLVNYNAGDSLHMVLFATQNFGIANTADEIVEFQKLVVNGGAIGNLQGGGDVGGTSYETLNDSEFGVFNASQGAGAWTSWDGNLGTAPNYDGAGNLTFVP